LADKTVAIAVSKFGASIKSKLVCVAITGAPEDQLCGPLDSLVRDLAELGGLSAGTVHLVEETTRSDLKTQPDFAATIAEALVGFIEVKASEDKVPDTELKDRIAQWPVKMSEWARG
jgi:hypothetical protein